MIVTAYGQLLISPLVMYLVYECYKRGFWMGGMVGVSVLGGQSVVFLRAQKYLRSIVYKMEYIQKSKQIRLHKVIGKHKLIETHAENIHLKDVINNDSSYRQQHNSQNNQDFQSFIVLFDVLNHPDQHQSPQPLFKDLKLLVEPQMSEVENIDLFRTILNGDQEELDQFYFIEK